MTDNWRLEHLEERNDRLEAEVNRLKTQIQLFVNERNQIIGMGKAARWGIKIIFAFGGYGLFKFLNDMAHWLNAPLGMGRSH